MSQKWLPAGYCFKICDCAYILYISWTTCNAMSHLIDLAYEIWWLSIQMRSGGGRVWRGRRVYGGFNSHHSSSPGGIKLAYMYLPADDHQDVWTFAEVKCQAEMINFILIQSDHTPMLTGDFIGTGQIDWPVSWSERFASTWGGWQNVCNPTTSSSCRDTTQRAYVCLGSIVATGTIPH